MATGLLSSRTVFEERELEHCGCRGVCQCVVHTLSDEYKPALLFDVVEKAKMQPVAP
jgi:hypothetical protein